jgi:hypothetical protein
MTGMSRSSLGTALSVGAILFGSAASAAAQTSSLDQPYPEGFSILRIEPAPAGDRFFAVPDATTSDAEQRFRAMLLMHETLAPSIERTDNDTGETREIVSNQLTAHADATVVIAPFFDANLDLPVVLVQKGEGPAAPDAPALGDLRLSGRGRLIGSEHAPFSFAGALDLWLPTGSEKNLTGDESFRAEPKLLASGRASLFLYSTTLGVIFREHVDTGAAEVGTSLAYGAACGLALLDDRLVFGPELYGSALLVSERDAAGAQASSPLEALFGVRGRFGDVALGIGAGLGLSEAPGVAPRILASIAYAPSTPPPAPPPPPPDGDRDGVPDADDACPGDRGPKNADPKLSGCPEMVQEPPPQAPPPVAAPVAPPPASATDGDDDDDGIPDATDACPHEAASLAPGSPTNGCPGTGPAEAIFAGYRQGEGGHATVFVELTDSTKVSVEKTKNGATYVLTGTTVALRNNQNPLLAMDFASNVESARLVREKDSVRLVVVFRSDVTPTHRIVRRGRVAALEVDVPPK